jgi:hypothetical protein
MRSTREDKQIDQAIERNTEKSFSKKSAEARADSSRAFALFDKIASVTVNVI